MGYTKKKNCIKNSKNIGFLLSPFDLTSTLATGQTFLYNFVKFQYKPSFKYGYVYFIIFVFNVDHLSMAINQFNNEMLNWHFFFHLRSASSISSELRLLDNANVLTTSLIQGLFKVRTIFSWYREILQNELIHKVKKWFGRAEIQTWISQSPCARSIH